MENQESRFGINIGPFVICRRKQLEERLIRAEEKAFKRIKRDISSYEWRERCRCITPRGAERLSELRSRLEYLEDILKKDKSL